MYYSDKYEPRLEDYDLNFKLSGEALLRILENVGYHHGLKVNDTLTKDGIAWVLVEWKISFIDKPSVNEALDITTWARVKNSSTTIYRDFLIKDSKGNTRALASSKFALLDTNTGRIARITPELMESYGPEDKTVFVEDLPRLSECDSYDSEMNITLRKADIDFNGHVHNTRYLELVSELLDEEDYKKDEFKEVAIVYKKPVKLEDKVIIKMKKEDSLYSFAVYSDDNLCTLIEMSL